MKLNWILVATVVMTVAGSLHVEAKRLSLRPMSAREVYRVLKEAGREDAVPEGRVVTQGIAAIKGFALGVTKGIGGALLVDLATSNATQQFISNLNITGMIDGFQGINVTGLLDGFQGINMTGMLDGFQGINMSAITGLFNKGGSGDSAVQYQTQEICFSSRSVNEIDDEANDGSQARQTDIPTTSDTVISPTTSATTIFGPPAPSFTQSETPTYIDSPTVTQTNTNTGTGTGTNVDTGTATGTVTNTETQTGTGGSVNCVVIEKPVKGRKRRAVRIL